MKSSNIFNPNLQKQPPNLNNPKGGSIPQTPNLSNPSKNLTFSGEQSSGFGIPASNLNYGPVLPTATNNFLSQIKEKIFQRYPPKTKNPLKILNWTPKTNLNHSLAIPHWPVVYSKAVCSISRLTINIKTKALIQSQSNNFPTIYLAQIFPTLN